MGYLMIWYGKMLLGGVCGCADLGQGERKSLLFLALYAKKLYLCSAFAESECNAAIAQLVEH